MFKVNIHKRFKGKRRGFYLSFSAQFGVGQMNFLFGPSGSGKTSVLRILAGLEKAENGEVVYNEKTWYSSDYKINISTKERNVAMVFQQAALFPNMTVRENLEYALSSGLTAEIDQLCKDANVGDLLDEKPNFLSGGESQRISIIRSLCIQSNVLLLDEPFSALDDKSAEEILDLLRAIQVKRKTTIVLATHRKLVTQKFNGHRFEI